jgi:radical SAM protein with 4Fe4S-binding SPASM domain
VRPLHRSIRTSRARSIGADISTKQGARANYSLGASAGLVTVSHALAFGGASVLRVNRRLDVLRETFRPVYVVWELTLRCDQPCTHCGSRAGDARTRELSTHEALGVVAQLAEMGAREVVLIGGEAYLHEGFLSVVTALRDAGVLPTITTGGRGIDEPLARAMADAGLAAASVSIDGLETTHDRMRASKGSFAAATDALEHLRAAHVPISANTNLNRFNQRDLEPLYEHLRDRGIGSWQVQLTVPLGRAADRPEMILQPYELLDLVPRIATLKTRAFGDGVVLMPGNNLGYFGPEEALLRSPREGGRDHFAGCQAGRFVLGIESDGAVKGCPSLQTTPYVGGTLVARSLASIWNETAELAFTRADRIDSLWGFCRTCDYADPCLGGCTFTAHALLGRPGNNPYCHHRARMHARDGLRERLVKVQDAPGTPFDHGRFELIVEPLEAPLADESLLPAERLLKTRRASERR